MHWDKYCPFVIWQTLGLWLVLIFGMRFYSQECAPFPSHSLHSISKYYIKSSEQSSKNVLRNSLNECWNRWAHALLLLACHICWTPLNRRFILRYYVVCWYYAIYTLMVNSPQSLAAKNTPKISTTSLNNVHQSKDISQYPENIEHSPLA